MTVIPSDFDCSPRSTEVLKKASDVLSQLQVKAGIMIIQLVFCIVIIV